MNTSDYVVLSVYMIGVLGVGVVFAMRNKSAAEMFAADGQSPWWAAGLSGFMTMFSAGTFVVWGGIAYKYGLVAVAINLCYGIAALLVGHFVAGRWNHMRLNTPGEFIELRYGRGALHFYTWSMMLFRVVSVAVALYSMAVLLVASMPLAEANPLRDPLTGNLSLTWAILLFGGIVVLYTLLGGLWAVLMTDVVQFIVLNLAVAFVVPLALSRVGGWTEFVARVPEGFFNPTAPTIGYTWFFLAGWVAIHYFVIGAEWAFVQRFLCVPTPRDAAKSAYLFGGLYLVSPFLWLLPPLIYRVESPIPPAATAEQINQFAERAYIDACQAVLPAGMIGLLIAAMFSATASMVSSQLNVFAGVLTNDIYRPLLRESVTETHLVTAGRIFTMLIGALFIGMALAIPYLGGAEQVIITATSLVVGPLLAPAMWGLFSRTITPLAVWITAIVCGAAGVVVKFGMLKNEWLLTNAAFAPLARWMGQNEKTVDLILGVALPVLTLAIIQVLSSGTAIGWSRVEDPARRESVQRKAIERPSGTPTLVVGCSLLACAAMMGTLAMFDDANRLLLATFAGALAVMSAVPFCLQQRLERVAEPSPVGGK